MFAVWHPDQAAGVNTQPKCWQTYEELYAVLSSRMAKDGYKVVKARSHRGRVNGAELPTNDMVRVDLVCDRGGRPYMCHATKHKTTTKKTGCPWKAKAVKRKSVGGWTLDIVVDEHNHEPGTPEPIVEEEEDAEGEADAPDGATVSMQAQSLNAPAPTAHMADGPSMAFEASFAEAPLGHSTPEQDAAAVAVTEMIRDNLRLSGDNFHKIKQRYRKMTRPQRVNIQAQLQFHMAVLLAIENEDVQRQHSQDMLNRRHAEAAEENRRLVEQQNQERMAAIASGRAMPPRKRPASSIPSVGVDGGGPLAGSPMVIGTQHQQPHLQPALSSPQRQHHQPQQPQHQPQQQHHQQQQNHQQQQQQHPQQHPQQQHPQQQHPQQHPQQSQTQAQYPQTPVPLPSFPSYPMAVPAENGILHPPHDNMLPPPHSDAYYPNKRHRGHGSRKS